MPAIRTNFKRDHGVGLGNVYILYSVLTNTLEMCVVLMFQASLYKDCNNGNRMAGKEMAQQGHSKM